MLNKEEQNSLQLIEKKYYMSPVLERLHTKMNEVGSVLALEFLYEIITASNNDVTKILEDRKEKGTIKDLSQARKSIAGQIFSNCILYLVLKSKEQGFLRKDIFVTDKTKSDLLKPFTVINVDGETQKPDMDLAFYTLDTDKNKIHDCLIVSLKTSLRERAGQTYKWKLLLEIATTESSIKEKYNISYNQTRMPKVCFATVNFYDEINSPQHRGMFKFFDNSFIGKPIDADFIQRLSHLIMYANEKLESICAEN